MPEFLRVTTLEKAKKALDEYWRPRLRASNVPLDDALGRVLAKDIISKINVPQFDKAVYDGYAVRASDTFGAGEDSPKEFELAGQLKAGVWPRASLRAGDCIQIATGAPMPRGSNAVAMAEHAVAQRKRVKVYRAVAPGENVAKRGSDIRKGQRVVRAGKRLTLTDIGALAAVGVGRVAVSSKPNVAIISSGEELVKPGQRLSPGKVYDVNGPALSEAVRACGAEPIYLGITPDRASAIKKFVQKGLNMADVVLISGGSSAGAGDIAPHVIDSMGEPGVIVHGLAMKPGKPTFIAVVRNKPIFGLPGYPVSALMVFDQLVADYIHELSGVPRPKLSTVRAKLTDRVLSARGRRELVPVRVIGRGDGARAEPILKGSGAITSLSTADGYIEVPIERELVEEGEIVEVKLFGGERID